MPKPVLERLRNYFQDIADALSGEKSASSIFPNTSDVGMTREDILMSFLRNHLPKRCEVIKGGFIFDKQGNESKQIDLIVTNDLTLQFNQFDKSFNCVEGCNAAISVKSNLDKQQLFDALDNIASIPLMPDDAVNYVSGLIANKELILTYPIRIIFAYEGSNVQTTLKNIEAYYKNNNVPHVKRPNMIIVNNKYIITRIDAAGGTTRDGQKIPPNVFFPMSNVPYVGSFSLFFMLTKVQTAANISPHIIFSFNDYLDRLPI